MDFIAFCDRFLERLVNLEQTLPYGRDMGVEYPDLFDALFEYATEQDKAETSPRMQALVQAQRSLLDIGLVETDGKLSWYWKVPRSKRLEVRDLRPMWRSICATELQPDEEQLLRIVNELSEHQEEDFAYLDYVAYDDIGAVWQKPNVDDLTNYLEHVFQDLEAIGLVRRTRYIGDDSVCSTYAGLVWTARKSLTKESDFIDALVDEWETTSVEFKREVHTRTADEKAELIKDILGLANTQASGRRWLIIGFDDKTREYHGPPDPKLSKEHLEQLLSRYTEPVVLVQYAVVDYRRGPVGKLEILRDRARLPYQVAKSINAKKRFEREQVFVRHGSHTVEATPLDLQALRDEAAHAKSIDTGS